MTETHKVTFTQAPEYRENYSNTTSTNTTIWDFQLIFGMIRAASVEGLTVENFQRIILSPQQAKALAQVLINDVKNYEQAFGEIKLQPQTGVVVAGVIQ